MENEKIIEYYAYNMIRSLPRFSLQIRRNFVFCFVKVHGYIPEKFLTDVIKMLKS